MENMEKGKFGNFSIEAILKNRTDRNLLDEVVENSFQAQVFFIADSIQDRLKTKEKDFKRRIFVEQQKEGKTSLMTGLNKDIIFILNNILNSKRIHLVKYDNFLTTNNKEAFNFLGNISLRLLISAESITEAESLIIDIFKK